MVRDGQPQETLDRLAYAMARARGHAMHRAAQMAGSEARSVEALCHSAARLEAEAGVQEAIAKERAAIKAQTDRAWERSLETAADDLENPDYRARASARDFFGKVGGRFVQKTELSGPGGGAVQINAATLHAIALDAGDRASALAFVAKLAAGVSGALPEKAGAPDDSTETGGAE